MLRRPRLVGLLLAGVVLLVGVPVALIVPKNAVKPVPDPSTTGRFAINSTPCKTADGCLQEGATRLRVASLGVPAPGGPFKFVSGEILSSQADGTTVHMTYAARQSSISLTMARHTMTCRQLPPRSLTETSASGKDYCQIHTEAVFGGWVQRGPIHYTLLLDSADPGLLATAVDALTPGH